MTDDDRPAPLKAPTPRWVRVAQVLGVAGVLILIILMLAGGHGPWEHFGAQFHRPGGALLTAEVSGP
jgi:hypothetical protein